MSDTPGIQPSTMNTYLYYAKRIQENPKYMEELREYNARKHREYYRRKVEALGKVPNKDRRGRPPKYRYEGGEVPKEANP